MKTTKPTDTLPEIEWDDLQHHLLEVDSEERMKVYVCRGTGKDGKEYSGIAYFFCDELDKVEDIEEA